MKKYNISGCEKSIHLEMRNLIIANLFVIIMFFSISKVYADGVYVDSYEKSKETVQQDQKSITGTVTDPNGEALIGVTVAVKGTSQGALTDSEGKYQFSTSVTEPVLVFSYVGFTTQEIPIGNKSVIDVKMSEVASELSEVVVTAMGIRREQKSLGYAVS
ncbi:MAG: carboxypeptidase-like regulatory domain-containing protein, partial [Bacteroidales bacterium]